MLLNILSNILELPSHLTLGEAQKKLQGTYMVLNDSLEYIREINEESIVIGSGFNVSLIEEKYIESLVPWLPETGVSFVTPDSRVLLYKYPEKQWRKSFCYDFYTISALDLIADETKYPKQIFEKGLIKTNKPYLFKARVYYLDKHIGYVDTKGGVNVFDKYDLYVTDGRFFQECYEEFSKEFNVCLKN